MDTQKVKPVRVLVAFVVEVTVPNVEISRMEEPEYLEDVRMVAKSLGALGLMSRKLDPPTIHPSEDWPELAE